MALHFLVSPEDQKLVGESAITCLSEVYGAFFDQDLSVELSSASREDIKALNKEYRNLDEATDVLSFPTFNTELEIKALPKGQSVLIGSIIICPSKAEEYGETLPQLVNHGILHLLGFDHEIDTPTWLMREHQVLDALEDAGLSIKGIEQWP